MSSTTFKRVWFSFWIHLAYLLRLRRPFNSFQRWWKERGAEKSPLFLADHPLDVLRFAKEHKFEWREDATRIGGWTVPLDWVSDPRVFQARLEKDPFPEGDGDCDDYHYWFATCVSKIPGVGRVVLCSSGFRKGGHTTCAYEWEGGWWLVNYEVSRIDDPNDIPRIVAEWARGEGAESLWHVFEDLEFNALAIGPKGKLVLDLP